MGRGGSREKEAKAFQAEETSPTKALRQCQWLCGRTFTDGDGDRKRANCNRKNTAAILLGCSKFEEYA